LSGYSHDHASLMEFFKGTANMLTDEGKEGLFTSIYSIAAADLMNPLILKDSKMPEFLIPAHDDMANRAGQKRVCASRSSGWNWFMIF
jgi:hypothetical protein